MPRLWQIKYLAIRIKTSVLLKTFPGDSDTVLKLRIMELPTKLPWLGELPAALVTNAYPHSPNSLTARLGNCTLKNASGIYLKAKLPSLKWTVLRELLYSHSKALICCSDQFKQVILPFQITSKSEWPLWPSYCIGQSGWNWEDEFRNHQRHGCVPGLSCHSKGTPGNSLRDSNHRSVSCLTLRGCKEH